MTHGQKKIRFALGITSALFGATATLIACGGDDTSIGGGQDAATDGTVPPGDGGRDAGDAGDATTLDGMVTGDSGGDSASDAGDASDAADAADANNSAVLIAYAQALAAAYCTNLKTACATYDAGAGVDAGVIDLAYCEQEAIGASTTLFEDSTLGILFPNALGHGDITYDPAAAQKCIADVTNLDLSNVQSTTYQQTVTDCFAVSHGTLPLNSPCYTSLECAANSWCDLGLYDAGVPDAGDAGDGGDAAAPVPPPTGLCVPLVDAGGSCLTPTPETQTNNYQFSGVSCSYLGSSFNGAFCDSYETYSPDPNTPTCIQGLLDIDASCPYDLACQSSICELDQAGDNAFCKASTNLLSSGICGVYQP